MCLLLLKLFHITIQYVILYITAAVAITQRLLWLSCALCAREGITTAISSQ